MNVVLAVDAINPALTGIGRYTWELATRLPALLAPNDQLRYMARHRWVSDIAAMRVAAPVRQAVRRSLVRSQLAAAVYAVLWPIVMRYRLNSARNAIYHGTNFYVPPGTDRAIATFHDLSIYRHPECHPSARVAFMQRALPQTLKRSDFIITVSEFTRREVIEFFGWPADKIKAIPLGVDNVFKPHSAAETEAVLQALGLQHDGYVLCTATIEPRKNISRLLAAYALLPATTRARWPLVLAGGDGWNDDTLRKQIQQAEQAGWLQRVGYVDDAALPALMAGARCFAFPSIYEGFGLPVLEAMASGVPVVTADIASLPEVAGDCALLIDPYDVNALHAALDRALHDDPWRQQAGTLGIQRAAGFGWDRTAADTAAVYKHVAAL
jgi:glycosyltransferase involved in cell wall biosynthesis